jgi:hypothetical protein
MFLLPKPRHGAHTSKQLELSVERNVRPRRLGQYAGFAWVFRRLHFRARFLELVAAIEIDGGGVVEVAGIERDPAHGWPPRQVEKGFHHKSAKPPADEIRQ